MKSKNPVHTSQGARLVLCSILDFLNRKHVHYWRHERWKLRQRVTGSKKRSTSGLVSTKSEPIYRPVMWRFFPCFSKLSAVSGSEYNDREHLLGRLHDEVRGSQNQILFLLQYYYVLLIHPPFLFVPLSRPFDKSNTLLIIKVNVD